MTFQHELRRALHALGLPADARHILVAVSGGADSVALLCALHDLALKLGLKLKVAHLHHGLRGAEADADARFVRALARQLRVPCVVARARVAARARREGVSVEMAARAARYAFLTRAARGWSRAAGAPVCVATAHTADDQAETLLLRLARGAGAGGLAGIPAQRLDGEVRIVRPLLSVRRKAVVAFLNGRRQAWREDLSNRDPAMLRNRVRHELLPQLAARLNPEVTTALIRTADVLRAENDWMEGWVAERLPDVLQPAARRGGRPGLVVAALHPLPLAARRRLIVTWLRRAWRASEAAEFQLVEAVGALAMRGRPGGPIALPGGFHVARRAGVLHVEKESRARAADAGDWRVVVRLPGTTRLPKLGLSIITAEGTCIQRERPCGIGTLPACATIAWGRLGRRPLVVRRWEAGDRIAPLGLRGSQKLQDLFVNAKVPRAERLRIPVFVCGGEVVWIPGYRIAQGWEIRSARERMLELRVERRA